MTANKTTPTNQYVIQFLNGVEDERKRQDSLTLLELMKEATGLEPKMWGSSIVGFGSRHYKYESGREGDTVIVGLSPRKQNLTLYGLGGFEGYAELLKKLGKHTLGGGCLYLKRLEDVDLTVLKSVIEKSFKEKQAQS